MARKRDEALRRFVEDVALLFEGQGLPRMAGRIFGWLLVSENPSQTLEELGAAVGGSKASMSTMTRLLLQTKILTRMRWPGSRSDSFCIRPDAWNAMFEDQVRFASAGRELSDRGLELMAGRPAQDRMRLLGFREGCVFMERAMPRLLEDWQRDHAGPFPQPPAPARLRGGARRVKRS